MMWTVEKRANPSPEAQSSPHLVEKFQVFSGDLSPQWSRKPAGHPERKGCGKVISELVWLGLKPLHASPCSFLPCGTRSLLPPVSQPPV